MGSNEEYLDKLLQSVTSEEKQHETEMHERSQDMSDDELLESLLEMYSEELADFKEAEIIHKDETTEDVAVVEESVSLDDLLGSNQSTMNEFEGSVSEENEMPAMDDLIKKEAEPVVEKTEEYTVESDDYLSQDDIEALLSSLQDDLTESTSEVVNSEKIIEDFSSKNDSVLEELLEEPQTIESEDADILIPEKDDEYVSAEDNLLKEMGIDSMSAEQIDELLNAASESEQPKSEEMNMDALFGGFGFADDFDPEHKASEEMADLLGGMLGGNDDLAEISELLTKADNNENVQESNLENLLGSEDEFGGNNLLNELLHADEGQTPPEEVKAEKKSKKEKKPKVKKQKAEKQPKVKKEGESFWKKLTSVLFEEEEEPEEGKKVKITDGDELATLMNADENDAILAEMMNEDKQNGKKKKDKKKKDNKKNKKNNKDAGGSEEGEEVVDPKEQAKQAKLKEKAEKKAAKKKAKEEKAEADRLYLKAQPSISTKRAMVAVLFAISILGIVLVIYIFVPVAIEKASARKAFYQKDYYEAYELLQGKELNDSDRILLNKVTCILKLQRKLDSYHNYVKLDQPLEAINSLMEAVVLYNENCNYAKALSIDTEYKAIYDEVLLILNGRYGVNEELAKEINACASDAEYTVRLYYLIEGKTWGTVEEENGEKPMEDVLPEEEEFLEGQ